MCDDRPPLAVPTQTKVHPHVSIRLVTIYERVDRKKATCSPHLRRGLMIHIILLTF